MTEEKMIPISVIDARIKQLESLKPKSSMIKTQNIILLEELQTIKKEAISFPIFSIMESSLEQKIKDRIAELAIKEPIPDMTTFAKDDPMVLAIIAQVKIDELRKLLE